jgi:hypothetical protein
MRATPLRLYVGNTIGYGIAGLFRSTRCCTWQTALQRRAEGLRQGKMSLGWRSQVSRLNLCAHRCIGYRDRQEGEIYGATMGL